MKQKIRSTTILGIVHNGVAALGGDGQVSLGNTVMKHNALKLRKISNGKVLCGFAGGTADAFALMERFEDKLEQYRGNVNRAAVELARNGAPINSFAGWKQCLQLSPRIQRL